MRTKLDNEGMGNQKKYTPEEIRALAAAHPKDETLRGLVGYLDQTEKEKTRKERERHKELDATNLLAKLSDMLETGTQLASTIKVAVRQDSEREKDPEKYKNVGPKPLTLKEVEDWIGEWYMETAYAITRYTENTYHLYMFMRRDENYTTQASGDPKTIEGMLKMLGDHLDAVADIMRRVEERVNVQIRQDIARQEYDKRFRYWLTYDDVSGKLYLNDNILLASPRLDSPADRILQQVFKNPGKLIELTGVTIDQISSSLRDMRFTGTIKDVFFPRRSGKKIFFRPNITNSEYVNEGFKDISLSDISEK